MSRPTPELWTGLCVRFSPQRELCERLFRAFRHGPVNFIGRGIDAGNIATAGAGSAVPVADNGNRYGRGLNRRIEVRFSYEPVSSGDVSLTSSISNSSVAFGGTGGLPRAP